MRPIDRRVLFIPHLGLVYKRERGGGEARTIERDLFLRRKCSSGTHLRRATAGWSKPRPSSGPWPLSRPRAELSARGGAPGKPAHGGAVHNTGRWRSRAGRSAGPAASNAHGQHWGQQEEARRDHPPKHRQRLSRLPPLPKDVVDGPAAPAPASRRRDTADRTRSDDGFDVCLCATHAEKWYRGGSTDDERYRSARRTPPGTRGQSGARP